MVALEGAHIGSAVKQIMFTASCKDGNNEIVLLAFAVCQSENEDNWRWFLGCLSRQIPQIDEEIVTLISDRDKGLMKSIPQVFRNAKISYCCFHLKRNLMSHLGAGSQKVGDLFIKATRATTKSLFKNIMDEISKVE